MKRQRFSILWLGLMTLVVWSAAACSPLRQAKASGATPLENASSQVGETQVESCLSPATEENRQQCAEWERLALASTVRLEVRVFSLDQDGLPVAQVDGSFGHAAVKDGRYLVTHNHYSVSLMSETPGTISRLTLLRANGDVILSDVPLSAFRVVLADSQTLVLDFGQSGLFGAAGIASATFRPGLDVTLVAGMEVAQIDWDGRTTHVDWVRVMGVQVEEGTPYVELDNYVERGSSGGGVYFNGIHIANNWSHSRDRSVDTGEIVRQYSTAAFNSIEVAGGGNS